MSIINAAFLRQEPLHVRDQRPAPLRCIWDVLDEFAHDLGKCRDWAAQVSCVVKAIGAGILADSVLTYSDTIDASTGPNPHRALPTSCRHHLAEEPVSKLQVHRGSNCFLNAPLPPVVASGPRPCSTIMARLSKSRSLWVVAVSYSNQRLFRMDDLKVVLWIRRIFCEHRQQKRTQENLTDAVLGVIRGLNEAIGAKSPFTCGHSERVARMAVCLGQQMGLNSQFLSDLYLAGLLHDVGKIGIRDDVLQKQGALTEAEQTHVREHPLIGDTIVSKIKNLAPLRSGVRNHHEHFDGRGYPDGLAGDDIPLLAHIMSVADGCDAMMSPRPYRPGLPAQRVDAIMNEGAGTQWDPSLIQHFMACRHQLYTIYEKGIGESVIHAVEEFVRSDLRD